MPACQIPSQRKPFCFKEAERHRMLSLRQCTFKRDAFRLLPIAHAFLSHSLLAQHTQTLPTVFRKYTVLGRTAEQRWHGNTILEQPS